MIGFGPDVRQRKSLRSPMKRDDLSYKGWQSLSTMKIDDIRTVAVLGSGTMGSGIAHVFARCGYRVILRDLESRFLERAMETIGKNLDREIKKGKISADDKPRILARIESV